MAWLGHGCTVGGWDEGRSMQLSVKFESVNHCGWLTDVPMLSTL